jgi:hypothetical protein
MPLLVCLQLGSEKIRDRRCSVDVPAGYLHWGFIVISVPNFALIVAMVAVFVIALLAPFPGKHGRSAGDEK